MFAGNMKRLRSLCSYLIVAQIQSEKKDGTKTAEEINAQEKQVQEKETIMILDA